jgi:hypothetical protein
MSADDNGSKPRTLQRDSGSFIAPEKPVAVSPSRSLHKAAAHNRGCKFAREAAVKPPKAPDWYEFNAVELKGTAGHQFLEPRYRHLVQSSGDLAESCGSIVFES